MADTKNMSAHAVTAEQKKPRLRVTFRKAAQRDIEPMAKVFQRAFAATNEFTDPVGYLDKARHDGDYRLMVAKDPDGKVAGFVMTDFNSFTRGSIYVSQLAVDPGFQGQGIGRALMKQAENIALKNGFNKIALHVRKDNDNAIALYKSLGYNKIGSDWWYYADGTTGIEMLKSLRPAPANDNKGWGIGAFFKKVLGFAP